MRWRGGRASTRRRSLCARSWRRRRGCARGTVRACAVAQRRRTARRRRGRCSLRREALRASRPATAAAGTARSPEDRDAGCSAQPRPERRSRPCTPPPASARLRPQPRRRAAPQRQVALRRELCVRGRRRRLVRRPRSAASARVDGSSQPAGSASRAHERPQPAFDLEAERLTPVEVEREKWSCQHVRKWPFRVDHVHPTLTAYVKALHATLPAAFVAALVAGLCAGAAAGGGVAARAFAFQQIASGFTDPTDVTSAPGDPATLYVVEQAGRVQIVQNGAVTGTLLDIRDRVSTDNQERGLLSIAFHPAYARNHLFYADYTDLKGDTRVIEVNSATHAVARAALRRAAASEPQRRPACVRPRAAISTSAWATAAPSRESSATTPRTARRT